MKRNILITAALVSVVALFGILGFLFASKSASDADNVAMQQFLDLGLNLTPLPKVSLPTAPATPTASVQMAKTGPAYDLLRDAQKAMQGVRSYHFVIDNSQDIHTIDSNNGAAVNGFAREETVFPGDTVPPVARYADLKQRYLTESGLVVIGNIRYKPDLTKPNVYGQGWESASPAYIWANTSGVSNPEEYINFTLDTARCASIVGEEKIDGVDVIHARYILPDDNLMKSEPARQMGYSREIWIEKGTKYVRQLQEHVLLEEGYPCEHSLNWEAGPIMYTTGVLTYSKFNEPVATPVITR